MKIAYIGSRGFPGFNAGVEKSLEELCPRLAARGHDITLYCSSGVSTSEALYKQTHLKRMPAIPTKHFETISRTALSAWDAVFKSYDVVHFHSIGPALMSWMTRFSAKTVVTVHGLDWQRAKWGLIARTALQVGEKLSSFFPHQTIVVSKYLKRYFKERHKKNVLFIPNGVNPAEVIPARVIRDRWQLEPNGYVLFSGRLVPEKECHTMITAFRRTRTDKSLVIAGASWYSDGYVEKLKWLAGNDPRIVFTGWAEGALMQELFSNAYFFCLPSKIEGLSLALLEAMSFALCPLVSNIPENEDVIEENGVSFQVGNIDDLAEKMQSLFDDPSQCARLGQQAREAVMEEYSWDRSSEELERAYGVLCG